MLKQWVSYAKTNTILMFAKKQSMKTNYWYMWHDRKEKHKNGY